MDNTDVNQQYKRQDRSGANNPMWQRKHTTQSREKMSLAAQQRAAEIKKWKDSQHHITIDEFLSNNPSVKEYIVHLVKQQIKEMICNKNAQRI